MKCAIVFPGQGSQQVGMAKDFYETSELAKQLIDEADMIVPNLKQVMFEGPEETLKETRYTQPAIVTASIVAYELFKEKTGFKAQYLAGHSLGEFTALYAAGVLNFKETIELVKRRAELMNSASEGKMAAIVGLPIADVEAIVEETRQGQVLTVANYNSPEQVVISGSPEAIDRACALAATKVNPRRVIQLPVSGAFHSALMQDANDTLADVENSYDFKQPQTPVVCNLDGEITTTADALRTKLSNHIISSVQWVKTMQTMLDNDVKLVAEVGPGKVLTGLFKKMTPDLELLNVQDNASLEEAVSVLQQQEACV